MKTHLRLLIFVFVGLLALPVSAATRKLFLGPTGSDAFGGFVTVLPNGNFVVRDPGFDQPSPAVANVGAVSLYRFDGVLIGRVTGSTANDQVGSSAIVLLSNGNFLVVSTLWNGTRGAVTWGHAQTGFIGGGNAAVSVGNSVLGSTSNDFSFSTIITLPNGNFVVATPQWDNGGQSNAGAVTWGNGNTGTVGVIGPAISLVGSKLNDQVGGVVKTLSNGNFVVVVSQWDNGATANVGAVTWVDGSLGITGAVSAANSLVGSTAQDQVGGLEVVALTNGNYVVSSFNWSNAGAANAGAVTWGNGATGITGPVTTTNSLVGSVTNDFVGTSGVVPLTNGNYVVASALWNNGAITTAGAVTWGSGLGGTTGPVSTGNSLVGTTINDKVGSEDITPLTNGNYVVRSGGWDNGGVVDAGAVTWGNGVTGTTGPVTVANSLVGTTINDNLGNAGAFPLTNGNYVVCSSGWDNSGVVDAGAVTWGNGKTGVVGAVSAANSLVGTTAGDILGNGGVTLLPNGNYVVLSNQWNNGAVLDAGAVTWGNGSTGVKGILSAANSLVGGSTGDQIGLNGVFVLTNSNYVVRSVAWDNVGGANAGAVTWGSGSSGVKGIVSATNSLVGSTLNDQVGSSGVVVLSNGNYVIASKFWNNGGITDAGAATWGNGKTGVKGIISAANSLVGSTASDEVGDGVIDLPNGNYVVRSQIWDNGLIANVGAATWGNGLTGIKGPVSAANSLVGGTSGDNVGSSVTALSNGHYIVSSNSFDLPLPLTANVGVRVLCNGITGTTGVPNTGNSIFGNFTGTPLSATYDPVHEQMLVGDTIIDSITIFGNFMVSLAKTTLAAPGAPDIAFAAAGSAAVNSFGDVLFDFALSGAGSTAGRSRAFFTQTSVLELTDLVMQAGDAVSTLGGGLPANAKATVLGNGLYQQPARSLFQATVTGTGITTTNNRLLLRDNGAGVQLLHRTGESVSVLGGASISKFTEVLQSNDQDVVTVNYQLKPGTAPVVNANNDSGLLLMAHGGAFSSVVNAREGTNTIDFGLIGTFGAFTNVVSAAQGDFTHFVATQKPSPGVPFKVLFFMKNDFTSRGRTAEVGQTALGTGGQKYSSIIGASGAGSDVFYKATITGPAAQNEGLWRSGTLRIRKGDDVDSVNLPGVKLAKIIRFWPSGASGDQVIVQAQLSGTGVNATNNQALFLIQATNGNLVLLRSGSSSAGINSAKIGAISAVDVNPVTGHYAVLTTLTGAPATSNQALWTGLTQQGNDLSLKAVRLPVLKLRKGDRYCTDTTPLGLIKGIILKPAIDATGAGGRGLAQCVSGPGTAVYLLGDRSLTELVLVP